MKKEWLIKTLAVGIIILFIGVSFQPIVAEETVLVEKTSDYDNYSFEDAKEYLFQTLIEISNNPEVKEFIKQNNQRIFTSDYNYKSVFSQLLFKKPKLLKSMLFTKPEIRFEYLETSYVKGVELFNILDKEESLEMVDSISFSNPKLFAEFNNIIFSDKELFSRIFILGEINDNVQYNLDFGVSQDIICLILFFCLLYIGGFAVSFGELFISAIENHRPLLAVISYSIYSLFILLAVSTIYLTELLNCDINVTPP